MQARPIEQNATLLGAEPQVEPGSDSASKGLGFYGNVAMAMSTANGIEQFTRCGWGAGAMYGIFRCRLTNPPSKPALAASQRRKIGDRVGGRVIPRPPTPPDVRFRMRRFGGLSLSRPKNEADLSNPVGSSRSEYHPLFHNKKYSIWYL
jgi:hypothetical protein